MKKIIAFAGSNSAASINKRLIQHAASLVDQMDVIDLRDYDAPMYSVDLEKQAGIPPKIQELHELISSYDAVVMASPEHNGLPPAFFKNILDWLSRVQGQRFLQDKPVALLSTSGGSFGGATNLKNLAQLMPYWGAKVVGTYSLPKYYENIDQETGQIKSEEENNKLKALLQQL